MKTNLQTMLGVLPAIAAILLLGSHAAQANPFAVTAVNPSSQTVSVGDLLSIDITFKPGTWAAGTSGLETPINFDSSILQFASASSVLGGAVFDTSNSATGNIGFTVTGGFANGVTYTVATLDFLAIGPGVSAIDINPSQFLNGYGWYGINGLAVDGSVTVTGSAPPPSPTPDASSTFALLGIAMIGFAAVSRRLV